MIEVQHVSKSYGTLNALEDICVTIGDGAFVSIVGPSGCGKTTLLKIVAGLISPTRGAAMINSEPADKARSHGECGFVFQNPILLPWRNVLKNAELPLELLENGTKHARVRDPKELLKRLGLGDFLDSDPRELSGGMQQRVALARALSFSPTMLLMDEPFGALDEFLRERMDLELRTLTEELNQTVLLVTHNISEAVLLSDRVLVLSPRPGRLIGDVAIRIGSSRANFRNSEQHFGLTAQIRRLMEAQDRA